MGYIATEHSPPPHNRTGGPARAPPLLQTSPNGYGPSAPFRTSSPAGFSQEASPVRNSMYRTSSPAGFAQAESPKGPNFYQDSRQAFVTPRSASKASSGLPSYALPAGSSQPMDERGRTWTFKSDGSVGFGDSNSETNPARIRGISPGGSTPAPVMLQPRGGSAAVWPPSRLAQSPARSIYLPRSSSPGQVQQGTNVLRTQSPHSQGMSVSLEGSGGFSWAQAPSFSPRSGPGPTSMAGPRTASPVAARNLAQPGFAWSPEPPSPHTSPRALRSFPQSGSGSSLRQWSRP